MAIPLDSKTTTTPGVKFRKIEQFVDLACVYFEWLPEMEFGTERPKLNRKGEPRKQVRITGYPIKGDAVIVQDGADLSLKADELVCVYVNGGRLGAYIDAKKESPTGLSVGDVLRIKYTHDEPSKGGHPMKAWNFRIRQARDEERNQTEQCEAKYWEIKAAKEKHDEEPPSKTSINDDEIPF